MITKLVLPVKLTIPKFLVLVKLALQVVPVVIQMVPVNVILLNVSLIQLSTLILNKYVKKLQLVLLPNI